MYVLGLYAFALLASGNILGASSPGCEFVLITPQSLRHPLATLHSADITPLSPLSLRLHVPDGRRLFVSQLSFMKNDVKEEEREEEEEEEGRRSQSLLRGAFDEKESERSFQEALWEWRRESAATEPGAEPGQEAEPEQEVEPGAEPEEMWGLTEPLKGNACVSGVGRGGGIY